MTIDIVLMATVALLFAVAIVVWLAERTSTLGRLRSGPKGDALNAMARVEARVSDSGSGPRRSWGHPNLPVRRVLRERSEGH
jgi:hypothetical protein